ncbi:MAG: hypothetical protein A3C44_00565 [Gammaproteobacteria bacterium RIFCSPHIGHO2_02_FULL_39_13]|nr:MAG: hypothetical protein A3C44_00565 [Gammaproteobacteria bacterium RIFCSPHIGHO2_02_FULL_39_13]
MDVQYLEQHPALATSAQIGEICKPLEQLDITYFSFVRSYKDGSHIRLSNNAAWTKHYYAHEFYNVVLKQVPDENGNILWSSIDKYPLFYDASEHFDIDNGTVIVLTIDDITERYFFGSTRNNSHVNYIYLHQPELLKKFIIYFKDVANKLITEAESKKIILPPRILNKQDSEFYSNEVVQNFLNDIKLAKVSIRVNGSDMYISNNEAKILSLMKHGYTAKEISCEISLKKKTIEIYRDNLREKLNQYTRGNLVSLAQRNSLLDIDLLK